MLREDDDSYIRVKETLDIIEERAYIQALLHYIYCYI